MVKFATAMEQLCYYKSVLDGAAPDISSQEDLWLTQIQQSEKVCCLL
jgi:hypothetical protein